MTASVSLRNKAYEEVKRSIISGEYAPGARLSEGPLAEELRIGKTPIREALLCLVLEGFLEAVPHFGYTVTECTHQDLYALFDYRELIEVAAAERAAVSITETELMELESLMAMHLDGHEPALYYEFLQEHRRFHLLITRAARNRYLESALSALYDKIDQALLHRVRSAPSLDDMINEHQLLVTALRSRDPVAARHAVLVGLNSTRSKLGLSELKSPVVPAGTP